MIKIIGKILLVIPLFVGVVHAQVSLVVKNVQGAACQKVVVGKPFTVEVVIEDLPSGVSEPHIEHAEKFYMQRTGMYTSSINGHSTKKYSYLARVDMSGEYVLGPAVVQWNGQLYHSNKKKVVAEMFSDGDVAETEKVSCRQQAYTTLEIDTTDAVVGQKIECSLTFYTNSPDVRVVTVNPVATASMTYANIREPEVGVTVIDGVEYHYARWVWDAYPEIPGDIVIPASLVEYVIPSRKDYLLGGLSRMFGITAHAQQVYSNPCSVTVHEIPKEGDGSQAIGSFESFHASITPGVAKVGEGVLLTMSLTGDGNWDRMAAYQLQNMPDAFRYYDSKAEYVPSDDTNKKTKKMEFVVQALEAGEFQIPSQVFTFFDTHTRTIRTLETASLDLTILPNAQVALTIPVLPVTNRFESEETESQDTQQEKLLPLKDIAASRFKRTSEPIVWWMFFGCILFTFLCLNMGLVHMVLGLFGRTIVFRYAEKKIAFGKARTAIKKAQKDSQPRQLYQIFMPLILKFVVDGDTGKIGTRYEQLFPGSFVQNKSWEEFLSDITQAAFAKSSLLNKELFVQALTWIDILEKKI